MTESRNFINFVVKTLDLIIPNGQTESEIIQLKGSTLKTLILPAAFTGTTLTFLVSVDGSNFVGYHNVLNTAVSVTVSPNRAYGFIASDFYSIDYLKIVSNAAETAERTLKLIVRGI